MMEPTGSNCAGLTTERKLATIIVTIPDAQVARVRNAFAIAYNYQATIPDPANPGSTIPNPESKTQFAQRKVREYVKEVVKSVEAPTAGEVARKAAATAVDNEIILS